MSGDFIHHSIEEKVVYAEWQQNSVHLCFIFLCWITNGVTGHCQHNLNNQGIFNELV